MSTTKFSHVLVLIGALFCAYLQACQAAASPTDMPFLPAIKTAQDLPLRAEVGVADTVLMSHPGSDGAIALGPMPVGTKTFILQVNDSYANVLTAKGNIGWIALAALNEALPTNAQDFQRIVKAINDPTAQATLDPQQVQLLQATFVAFLARTSWGIVDSNNDPGKAMQQELAAISWIRSRNIQNAWPLLLGRWEDQFFSDVGYEYYGEVPGGGDVDWNVRFPGIVEALRAGSEIDRPLCRRLNKDETSGSGQYALGRNGAASNIFFLSLIRHLQKMRPLADCVSTTLRKIAANNHANLRNGNRFGDVNLAVELLGGIQSKAELEKWVLSIAQQPMPAFGANLAVALMGLKNVDVQPHIPQLMSLASSEAENASDDAFGAKQMAMWALNMRAPSKRVDALLRATMLRQYSGSRELQLRLDALAMLAQRPLEPGFWELTVGLVREPASPEPSRLRQLAVEVLATEPLNQVSLPILQTLMGDSDPYIGNIALQATRNDALRGMKGARSMEERSRIRGKYLESLRKQVDGITTKTDDPLFKKNPLWMLKPQARLNIQFSGDEPSVEIKGLLNVHIGVAPMFEPPARSAGIQTFDPGRSARLPEAYAIHPGMALFKYAAVGRKKAVTISLQLDDLVIDGQDIVSRAFPAIYTVTLNWPEGRTTRYAWYCEPDASFWSETGFDGDGGG